MHQRAYSEFRLGNRTRFIYFYTNHTPPPPAVHAMRRRMRPDLCLMWLCVCVYTCMHFHRTCTCENTHTHSHCEDDVLYVVYSTATTSAQRDLFAAQCETSLFISSFSFFSIACGLFGSRFFFCCLCRLAGEYTLLLLAEKRGAMRETT